MKKILSVNVERITFILLAVFCLTLPLKNNFNSMAIIVLCLFSFLVFIIYKKFDLKLFIRLLPLVFFFLLTLISVFYSMDKDTAMKMSIRLLPFLLFPFIFSVIQVDRLYFFKLLKLYVFWMTLVCLYSHALVLIKLYQNNDILFNLFNSYYSHMSLANDTTDMHTTYYAYYVLIAVVFLMFLIFNERKKIVRILYFILLSYFTFFIFHLSTRTPIFALFLFYNFSILFYFFKKKKMKQGVFFLLLLYFVTSIAIYNVRITRYRFQHIFGFTYAGGIHHEDGIDKLLQWQASIAANGNILFGNGIGDADNSIFKSYLDFNLKKDAEREYNAHNQFIQTYVALGLIGLLLLVWIFIFYFKKFYGSSFFLGYTLIAISFLLFQTESFLQRHHGIVMFGFLICFFMAQLENKNDLSSKKIG